MTQKLLLTVLLALSVSATLMAQKKIQQPAPKPAAAPTPAAPKTVPYLLKKDFEPIQADINNRLKNAEAAANAAKQSVNSKMAEVGNLSKKMVLVEEILNSANFRISLTSDSLKDTRMEIEDLKGLIGKLEKTNAEQAEQLKSKDSMLMGIIFGLSALILGLLFWMIGSVKNQTKKELGNASFKLENEIRSQSESLQQALNGISDNLHSGLSGLKAEVISITSKQANDLSSNFNERATRDKEALLNQIIALQDQLEKTREEVEKIKTPPPATDINPENPA